MSDINERTEETREKIDSPLYEATGDATLLGPYPEQSPDIVVETDLAGEVWGADIDSYPLRDAEDDPRWAIGTVWTWIGFALFCILFISTLMILGAFFD